MLQALRGVYAMPYIQIHRLLTRHKRDDSNLTESIVKTTTHIFSMSFVYYINTNERTNVHKYRERE